MSVKRYHRIRCWLPCVCICLFLYVWFVIIICALIQLCMYMLADLIFNWIFGYKNTQNKYFWFYSNVVLTTVHNTLQIPLPKTDFDHKLHNSAYPTRKPRLNEATVALKLVDLAAANVTMRPDAIGNCSMVSNAIILTQTFRHRLAILNMFMHMFHFRRNNLWKQPSIVYKTGLSKNLVFQNIFFFVNGGRSKNQTKEKQINKKHKKLSVVWQSATHLDNFVCCISVLIIRNKNES